MSEDRRATNTSILDEALRRISMLCWNGPMQDDYNYDSFVMANEQPAFAQFRNQCHVGGGPPDSSVEDLETGETLAMRSLWKRDLAILEFGSFT
jgi:hypothetical protein